MGRKTKMATKVADTDAGKVTFTFTDGTVQAISMTEIPAATQRALILHGIEQKGGDSYAGATMAVEEGRATNALAFGKASLARVLANLRAGIWTTKAEAGPSRLVRAVAEVLGIPVAAAGDRITGWEAGLESPDARMVERCKKSLAAVRSNPKIRLVLARMDREAAERRMAALAGAPVGKDDDLAAAFEE